MSDEPRMRHEATAPPPPVSLDEFVTHLGGWGVVLAMYLSLGGKIEGLPRAAQDFLARELEKAKQAKAQQPRGES